MPSRLPFPRSGGAAIFVFWLKRLVDTGCSPILLVGMVISRFLFWDQLPHWLRPNNFPFCAFSRTHFGLVLQFGLSQRCPFLMRNSVLSVVGNTVPCRGHICHSGNNNLSVAVSFCLPSLRRPLC